MTIMPDQLVNREVRYCVSSLISTLSGPAHTGELSDCPDMQALAEQAFELASPTPDYESAAIEAGWEDVTTSEYPPATQFRDKTDEMRWACSGWEALCREFDIEPLDREVYEHWIISDWLADRLEEHGEKVDRDFAGLTVWARTCTGQAIALDSVIVDICAEVNAA